MSDEPLTRAALASTLAEFHRAVVRPDIERIVGEALGDFRREMNGRFDDVYHRFERLEGEYEFIKVGLTRLATRLDGVEEALERIDARLAVVESRLEAVESDLRDLRAALHRLEERLSRMETRVDDVADTRDLRSRVDALREDVRRLEQRIDTIQAGPAGRD